MPGSKAAGAAAVVAAHFGAVFARIADIDDLAGK